MTKTKAAAIAIRAVTMYPHGRQWIVTGPYRMDEPDGDRTESNPKDFWQARAHRTAWRVEVYATARGISAEDAERAIYRNTHIDNGGDFQRIVDDLEQTHHQKRNSQEDSPCTPSS